MNRDSVILVFATISGFGLQCRDCTSFNRGKQKSTHDSISIKMTDLYKYNPYPDLAVVRCSRCQSKAEFRRAFTFIDSSNHGDERLSWWQPKLWANATATNWEGRESWVVGEPTPQWRGWIIIQHDPGLWEWKQPANGGYSGDDQGIMSCVKCGGRRRHQLSWPGDAYYQFALPMGTLWAWNRDTAVDLMAYIDSQDRDPSRYPNSFLFLRHIPKEFLVARHRKTITKLMERGLSDLS